LGDPASREFLPQSRRVGPTAAARQPGPLDRRADGRVNAEPDGDLISMLAHVDATRNMSPEEHLGNILLLIVGGNDTTRDSIGGSLLALNRNPDRYAKLRAHPELIPSMVSETIR
jgi:cytochrome P450